MRPQATVQETLVEFRQRYEAAIIQGSIEDQTNLGLMFQKLGDRIQIAKEITTYISSLEATHDNSNHKNLLDDLVKLCNVNSIYNFRGSILPTFIKSLTPYEVEGIPSQPLIRDAIISSSEFLSRHQQTPITFDLHLPIEERLATKLDAFGYIREIVAGFVVGIFGLGIYHPVEAMGEYQYQAMPVAMHDFCVHSFAFLTATSRIVSQLKDYDGQREQLIFIEEFKKYLNYFAIDVVQQFRLGEAVADFYSRSAERELLEEEDMLKAKAEEKSRLFRDRQQKRIIPQSNVEEQKDDSAPAEQKVKTQEEIDQERLIRLSVIPESSGVVTIKDINLDVNEIRDFIKRNSQQPLKVEERIDICRRLNWLCYLAKNEFTNVKQFSEVAGLIFTLFDPKICQPTESEKLAINLIKADLCSKQAMTLYKQIKEPEYDLVEVKNKEKGYLRPTTITVDQIKERKRLLGQYDSLIQSLKLNIAEIAKSPANTKDSEAHLAASMSIDEYQMVCKKFDEAIVYHQRQDESRRQNRIEFLEKLNAGGIPETKKTTKQKAAAESLSAASEFLGTDEGKINYDAIRLSQVQLQEVCSALSGKLQESKSIGHEVSTQPSADVGKRSSEKETTSVLKVDSKETVNLL